MYIHIPFCRGKCPYCDFYSTVFDGALADRYTDALCREIALQSDRESLCTTVYFGGGTPSLLGADRISRITKCISDSFRLSRDCEITLEANPLTVTYELMTALASCGINRISMGVQSGIDSELRSLGRRHSCSQAADAVKITRSAGISNISLDLMIATPGQTPDSLSRSVEFLASLEPAHISSYLLKIEEGTPYHAMADSLSLPDEDMQAELYLQSAQLLEDFGYLQYEISNFARPNMESRHNLRYWNGDEYLGFGPAAHGFFSGKRYSYPRDIMQYIESPAAVDEGVGGTPQEYAMLRLRLTEGLTDALWRSRFGSPLPESYIDRARRYEQHGLTRCTDSSIALTRQGFLLSNSVISEIIY
ncbi:MAG: radical SAM family heme chaperone HemW [Clostridia bacterium]|nr:radical SAM family heme chaperone HemW [Clostridia bacterium]